MAYRASGCITDASEALVLYQDADVYACFKKSEKIFKKVLTYAVICYTMDTESGMTKRSSRR